VANSYFAVPVTVSVLLIVDARHPGLDADLAARDWIATLGVPHAVVATKIDKLSHSDRARAARQLEGHMHAPVLPVSAETGEGLDDLWKHIVKLASR
jgi:GTP-binding protein